MDAGRGVRRLIPLTYGWVDLPKSVSVHGADPSIRLREPVPGVLCEIDGGWLLLDTGFNDALLRDPWLFRRFHGHDPEVRVEFPTGDHTGLEAAFDQVGVDPAAVQLVAVSHLHYDHAGGLRYFAGRVPVHCQRRELCYGLANHPAAEENGIFRVDFDDPRVDWRLADGDTEIAPGVAAVASYGHTPGHQSFVVTLSTELAERLGVPGFVFAFDAADLQENIDLELAVGGFIDTDAAETIDAIRRLKAIAAEKGFRVIPGHDPEVWPAFTRLLSD